MSHSFVHCLLHVVFSTHHRKPLIDPAWEKRLHAIFGGIANERGFRVLEAGGVADHVHLLMVLPSAKPVCDCLRAVKTNSSKWVNDTFFPDRTFGWQEGYGAFIIAQSQVEATVAYLRGQTEHHRERTFQDEFRDFLTRQGLSWDERYVWG